ncbi:hypothetical protein K0M31_012450 [Melipona bicolor]|uniref:Uncharacterized protein n=1 Tax=Melipona bicolor TaxID=60889 RepID=A0AA40KHH2_9HYME|nr:hypothetical protein K0M31_012450 [Melipona bicolor]
MDEKKIFLKTKDVKKSQRINFIRSLTHTMADIIYMAIPTILNSSTNTGFIVFRGEYIQMNGFTLCGAPLKLD